MVLGEVGILKVVEGKTLILWVYLGDQKNVHGYILRGMGEVCSHLSRTESSGKLYPTKTNPARDSMALYPPVLCPFCPE